MAPQYALGVWVLAVLFVADSSAICAADLEPASAYEGRPIAAVRFEPAQQPVLRADLARIVPFQPGAPLSLAEVQETIRRLYATGEYSDIEIETEPAANGVTVVIRTVEQWFAGAVEARGQIKSPPSRGQLEAATRLDLGAPIEDADLTRATAAVRDLLQRNGLYHATVEPQIVRDSEHQEISVTYQIHSGVRARLMLPQIVGNPVLPADELAHAARYKGILFLPWKPATQNNIQRGLTDIRKRFDKNGRLTASVMLDRTEYLAPQNRVRPVIAANAGPKIEIQTEGAKISRGKLETYVPVFYEETVNPDVLVTGARNLRDYFQSKGYFEATVDFRTSNPSPGLRRVTYVVHLGSLHKLVKVEIRGNHYFTTSDISDRLTIHPAGFLILRHGRYSEGLARHDADIVVALYRSNGFRDAKVDITPIDNYMGKIGDLAAIVRITEGPQYLVSSLDVQGISGSDRDTIVALLASQPGQPFSAENIAVDRNYLLQLYQSKGYPDVAFQSTAAPGPAPDRMALVYHITPGAPRYVREVLVYGLHTTNPKLIRPIMQIHPGDPLSWTEMGNIQRRLYNLGVFDTVDMAIQNPDGDVENKYIIYHLMEGHLYYMAVGFGAQISRIGGSTTSLDNPTGTTGFSPRADFQLSRINHWGQGRSADMKVRLSTIEQTVALDYLIPHLQNVDSRNLTFTALYDRINDVITFTGTRYEGSMQVSQKLSKATAFLLRYVWRNVTVNASNLKINPLLIPLESQPAKIALIGGNIVQDRRDDPTNAHRGYYNSVDFGLIDHDFGGNKNFTRLLARNSWYKTVWTRNTVLASNTEFGWIHPFGVPAGVTGPEYVPLPERFFGGGITTLRGFPDNQAGPRDLVTGFPIGGNALLFHQTELRFPFLGENLTASVFHDMGNVYSDLSSISFRVNQHNIQDFNYMVHAVGIGIGYRTPLGPLLVDLAYSINPPTFFGLKGTYNQLLFGGATPTIQNISHFQFFISFGQAF
jgi:outer membrane protein insertion porin family